MKTHSCPMAIVLLFLWGQGSLAQSADGPENEAEARPKVELHLSPAGLAAAEFPKAEIPLTFSAMEPTKPGSPSVSQASIHSKGRWDPDSQKYLVVVEIPPSTTWSVQLDDERYWLPPTQIWVSKEGEAPRELEVFRAATFSGSLGIPKESEAPKSLRFVFGRQAKDLVLKRNLERITVECSVDEDLRFACQGPAGVWDLRLSLTFHVPRYLWSFSASGEGESRLGQLLFRRGSSLAGWVTVPAEFDSKMTEVEIRVARASSGEPPRNQEEATWKERASLQDFRTRPNEKGFFQVVGLPEGIFELEAGMEPLGMVQRSPIPVEEDAESALFDPIELLPPAEVDVFFTPPMAPDGMPWELTLIDRAARKTVHQSTVDLGGSALLDGIDPGRYTLVASSGEGRFRTRWHTEIIEITSDLREHWIEVDVVAIEGEVLWGDEAVAAQVWFGGQDGAQSISLFSTVDDGFSGFLNREGEWEVDVSIDGSQVRGVEPVHVSAPGDGQPARVEVVLPRNEIYGQVYLANGRAADPSVTVLVLSLEHGRKISEVRCDEDGTFSIEGIRPGAVWLTARSGGDSSPPEEFVVEADERVGPVELRFDGQVVRKMRLVSEGGPVSRAHITYQPAGRGPRNTRSVTSDPNGDFEVRVPREATGVDLMVLSSSRSSTILRAPLPRDEEGSAQIEIPRHGGQLELDSGGRASRQVSLFANGVAAPQLLTLIRTYRKLTGVAVNFSRERLILPRMTAGFYVLCDRQFPDSLDMGLLESGGVPSGCEGGYLPQYGILQLSLPEHQEDESK